MNMLIKSLRKVGMRLARPDILFWTVPFMMGLLIFGTIAQKKLGIFIAQQDYFSSFYVLLGGVVPYPGGASLMLIFFINLLAKFLFKSDWTWAKTGTILSHFGVILLVLGGIVTAFFSKEGYLLIPQGETKSIVEDYHARELQITKDGTIVFTKSADFLASGQTIASDKVPFQIHLDSYCLSCNIEKREQGTRQDDTYKGPAQFMQLTPKAPEPEDEKNLTGIEFTLSNSSADGKYLTFDKFPKPPEFTQDGHVYKIIMGRQQRPLPFALELTKFTEGLHPGTDMAKSYRSDVIVHDKDTAWPAVIEMNAPLRYRGYTFYQSSFDTSGEKPFTVLSVVENRGRIFPYLASAFIAIGLLLHIALRLWRSKP